MEPPHVQVQNHTHAESLTHAHYISAQSSVFHGALRKRREETQGAQQVAEDEDTAVELPLDQVTFSLGTMMVCKLHRKH